MVAAWAVCRIAAHTADLLTNTVRSFLLRVLLGPNSPREFTLCTLHR